MVWNNLLANAVKFIDPGGTLKLTQTSDADKVTVIIEDNGPGMSEETIKHIFDKFYQGRQFPFEKRQWARPRAIFEGD
ncbi:sensor histidine kinase [Planomicrobium sp. CPCC 101110]|nr:sensor histidine kinase [Planomicrobium sp. CPCC 101110]